MVVVAESQVTGIQLVVRLEFVTATTVSIASQQINADQDYANQVASITKLVDDKTVVASPLNQPPMTRLDGCVFKALSSVFAFQAFASHILSQLTQ